MELFGKLLHQPSTEVESTEIFGRYYATFIKQPNLFVFDHISVRDKHLSFNIDEVSYTLNGCEYTNVNDTVHVECREYSIEYNG